MGVRSTDGAYEVLLCPPRRGAPDDLREQLQSLLTREVDFAIASQQVADRGVVDALADIRSRRAHRARVFVESRYLTEATPLPPERIWESVGDREPNRACHAALSRAGIEVRADVVGGALQHVNMVIADADADADKSLLLTSANLAPGSIDRHLNWAVRVTSPGVVASAIELFRAIWDGDFRGASMAAPLTGGAGDVGRIVAGADGEAVADAVRAIDQANERIRFAYFTMSKDTDIVHALLAAVARGVDVAGVVDADQGTQRWNAVPQLREGGVDARYYPGALTGASGRMHHKTIVIDRQVNHLATANASRAAQRSFELGVTLEDQAVAAFVDAEILRLGANASVGPIAIL